MILTEFTGWEPVTLTGKSAQKEVLSKSQFTQTEPMTKEISNYNHSKRISN